MRSCPQCGRQIPDSLRVCPHCDSAIPVSLRGKPRGGTAGKVLVRRGLLYMMMAGVFYYFLAGYTDLELPFSLSPMVTEWILPLLFLSGLGVLLYGVYCLLFP